MNWLLALYTVLAIGVWAGVFWLIRNERRERADHAKCMAHVASVTSNRIVALALREAATDYDSVDGEAELTRLRNSRTFNSYGLDTSASLPALWLRERADKIEAGL